MAVATWLAGAASVRAVFQDPEPFFWRWSFHRTRPYNLLYAAQRAFCASAILPCPRGCPRPCGHAPWNLRRLSLGSERLRHG